MNLKKTEYNIFTFVSSYIFTFISSSGGRNQYFIGKDGCAEHSLCPFYKCLSAVHLTAHKRHATNCFPSACSFINFVTFKNLFSNALEFLFGACTSHQC